MTYLLTILTFTTDAQLQPFSIPLTVLLHSNFSLILFQKCTTVIIFFHPSNFVHWNSGPNPQVKLLLLHLIRFYLFKQRVFNFKLGTPREDLRICKLFSAFCNQIFEQLENENFEAVDCLANNLAGGSWSFLIWLSQTEASSNPKIPGIVETTKFSNVFSFYPLNTIYNITKSLWLTRWQALLVKKLFQQPTFEGVCISNTLLNSQITCC